MGYDPAFLGEPHDVPLPLLLGKTAEDALENGRVYDFTHFSIVMNRRRKFAVYSAACVDESRLINVPRDNQSWHVDDRIGAENQVGPEYYAQNEYDKGHLTRRRDVCWGERREAEEANHDSFCYANIVLQHHNFNTGVWNCLEDWILNSLKSEKKTDRDHRTDFQGRRRRVLRRTRPTRLPGESSLRLLEKRVLRGQAPTLKRLVVSHSAESGTFQRCVRVSAAADVSGTADDHHQRNGAAFQAQPL